MEELICIHREIRMRNNGLVINFIVTLEIYLLKTRFDKDLKEEIKLEMNDFLKVGREWGKIDEFVFPNKPFFHVIGNFKG